MSDDPHPEPHPALHDITLVEWNDIAKKLLAYTSKLFYRYGGKNVMLSGGYSADDVAQEIVKRVLAGTRKWNPERHGDLSEYLMGQAFSIIYHWRNSWSGSIESIEPNGDEITAAEYFDISMLEVERTVRPHLDSPEQIMLEKEISIEKNKLSDLVVDAAIGDPELEALVETFLDSDKKYQRRYIAEKLGTTPDDVTNRWKRLSGRAIKLVREKAQRKEPESV